MHRLALTLILLTFVFPSSANALRWEGAPVSPDAIILSGSLSARDLSTGLTSSGALSDPTNPNESNLTGLGSMSFDADVVGIVLPALTISGLRYDFDGFGPIGGTFEGGIVDFEISISSVTYEFGSDFLVPSGGSDTNDLLDETVLTVAGELSTSLGDSFSFSQSATSPPSVFPSVGVFSMSWDGADLVEQSNSVFDLRSVVIGSTPDVEYSLNLNVISDSSEPFALYSPVPEPSSALLLGLGLVGLTHASPRRSF